MIFEAMNKMIKKALEFILQIQIMIRLKKLKHHIFIVLVVLILSMSKRLIYTKYKKAKDKIWIMAGLSEKGTVTPWASMIADPCAFVSLFLFENCLTMSILKGNDI